MVKRMMAGVKRRAETYRIKRNFADVSFSQPELPHKIPSPEFTYRDDNSTYISSFINHEQTDISPWEDDGRSELSRVTHTDGGMHLYSPSKKENWMCFFYRDAKSRYSFSFDVEDHAGLSEIQVSFQCSSLRERCRFMIRDNKTAVFEVIHKGTFYRYLRQKSCDIPLNEKHNITVIVDENRYSLLVDKKPVFSVRDRKHRIEPLSDNKMIMIFYNRNGEINCDVSSVIMKY